MGIKLFLINNPENMAFLTCCIYYIAVFTLMLFLFLLLAGWPGKSRKEKLHSAAAFIAEFLSNALLCGAAFFMGFDFRGNIFGAYPGCIQDFWAPSTFFFGTAFFALVFASASIVYIAVTALVKFIKKRRT